MNKLFVLLIGLALFVSCNSEKKETEANSETNTELKAEKIELANDTDPICNMSVKAHYEDTTVYQGKVYGFCNVACKEEFKKEPEKYAVK